MPPDPAPQLLTGLAAIVDDAGLLKEMAERWAYGYDNSRRQGLPDAVVLPTEPTQAQAVIALCNELRVPLVPRGRGTGTTGATVPSGGVVMSLERMDRIIELNAADRYMVVEPGVTNQAVQDAAAAAGFFWPPDPTSAAYCTVGGNLAYNSAGPRAIKYGTPRENTLGLRAVTGAGETLRTGVFTTKGVVGYDLTRLLIGSEGTLAVITEATLRLTPLPHTRRSLRAAYRDVASATLAITRIMSQPDVPAALEFMDGAAVKLANGYGDLGLPARTGALLLLEADGNAGGIETAVEAIGRAATVDGLLDLKAEDADGGAADIWAARKALSPALRTLAPKKINEDVVVPVSRLPALVDGLAVLSAKHGILIVNFGHAGNGNIHVNLLVDRQDPAQTAAAPRCLSEVFDLVIGLGGTLSGEHGVGLEKRDFVGRELDPVALGLMRDIKARFDPNGILNPGKMFPAAPPG